MAYVLCSRDNGNNRLYYYTGEEYYQGGSYYGDVLEAKRFESMQEVCELLAKPSSEFYLGINIINIEECTFEKLEESKAGDRDLYEKYHDPNYAIR